MSPLCLFSHTHTPVFTFLDSFVADMVYSQPAYIIKCTSDKGWLCLCFFNSTTLPFLLSQFLQALFEWNHAISLPPFFIPLVITKVGGAQLACFCWEGRRKKKAQSKSWSPYMYKCQTNMDALSSAYIAGWMLRLYHLINSQSFLRGCERLQDHSHRLLTEAAIGSDKKKGSIPTGLLK